MLSVVSAAAIQNTNFAINIYGQSMYLNSNTYKPLSAINWKHARVHIDGWLDLSGAGYVVENSHLIITSVFPAAHFVIAAALSWANNIVDAEDTNSYFALSTGTSAGTYPFKGIKLLTGQNLIAYGSTAVDRILALTNVSSGRNYTLDATTTSGIRHFTLQMNHEFIDTVIDSSFAPIENAKVFLDGGSGTTISALSNSSGEVTQSFRYEDNVHDNGVSSKTAFISGSTINKRIISYAHNISASEVVSVESADSKQIITSLGADALITATKAVADAYTLIDTSPKFYNRAKSYLFDNYAGEGEDNKIATLAGRTITTPYNVVVDATAASVFEFDGTTITIKATTFVGNITATGSSTVSTANGAIVSGVTSDANGTTGILELT